jgi:DNA-binding NtrC family response regulator
MKVALIEDEKITRIALANNIRKKGFDVESFESGQSAISYLKEETPDVVITDLRLPEVSGLEILKFIKERKPSIEVIMMTAYASVETAVEALKFGAYDYLLKPFEPEKILRMLEKIDKMTKILHENEELKSELRKSKHTTLIGQSKSMVQLKKTIETIATNDYTVLITGESGTGKEVVSKSVHGFSNRNSKPFIAINCAAIPESLLESELFGHEKGAFTGANSTHVGYFERANGGTLFIDEIDDFPLHLQVKLLRVLQEREITRVGGQKNIKIDLRIISATKKDLKKLVEEKKFREDLFYRLNIIPLHLPPLRERKEDIPLLIDHFLQKNNQKITFSEKDLDGFLNHSWEGNVRELENIVARMIALSDLYSSFSEVIHSLFLNHSESEKIAKKKQENYPNYQEYIEEKDKEILAWAMEKANGNLSEAARFLGLARSTLQSKLLKYKMN